MANIIPIQTYYNGYHFRSRLEARWAVVFDTWGVDWEYEPEGFELGNGMRYLPDFLIKGGVGRCPDKLYVEVKGELTERDKAKLDAFSGYDIEYPDNCAHIKNSVLLVGGIPKCSSPYESEDDYWRRWDSSKDHEEFYNFCRVDGDTYEAFPGINCNGKFSLFHDNRNDMEHMDFNRTNAGYIAGRSARFEYGESVLRHRQEEKPNERTFSVASSESGAPSLNKRLKTYLEAEAQILGIHFNEHKTLADLLESDVWDKVIPWTSKS